MMALPPHRLPRPRPRPRLLLPRRFPLTKMTARGSRPLQTATAVGVSGSDVPGHASDGRGRPSGSEVEDVAQDRRSGSGVEDVARDRLSGCSMEDMDRDRPGARDIQDRPFESGVRDHLFEPGIPDPEWNAGKKRERGSWFTTVSRLNSSGGAQALSIAKVLKGPGAQQVGWRLSSHVCGCVELGLEMCMWSSALSQLCIYGCW